MKRFLCGTGRTMEADMALPRKMHIMAGPMGMIKIDQSIPIVPPANL